MVLLSYCCTCITIFSDRGQAAGAVWPSDAPFARLLHRRRDSSRGVVDICAPSHSQPAAPAAAAARVASAGAPTGHVDTANATLIAGFALDPDSPSTPLAVQIYLDGVLWDQRLTSSSGNRFSWAVNQILGPADTNHTIQVVALGVNSSGMPDDHSGVVLPGGGRVSGSCAAIPEDCGPAGGNPAQEQCSLGAWCYDVLCYWQQRPLDTYYVENAFVRAGVNTAFGGTVFALHRVDSSTDGTTVTYSRNLILEHGGAAVQLSIWGYEPTGPAAWFRHGTPCDPTAYANSSLCASGGNTCVERCCSHGSQVLDCKAQQPCGGWTAGAPFNPIQAQGKDCGWDDHPGSSIIEWTGAKNQTLHTVMESAWHFTSNRSAAPVVWEQWTTAHDEGFVNLTYRMIAAPEYSGPAWGNTTQEVPAIFTARGINQRWYWYNGTAPGTGGPVTATNAGPPGGYLQFPGRQTYPHAASSVGLISEGW
eukprot:COSAG02_NODE_1827_length_10743_cov_19.183859_4_plen_477_part_00